MLRINDTGMVALSAPDRLEGGASDRTFSGIANKLSQRRGVAISAASVESLCAAADLRFVRALMADPVVSEWLRELNASRGRSFGREPARADEPAPTPKE